MNGLAAMTLSQICKKVRLVHRSAVRSAENFEFDFWAFKKLYGNHSVKTRVAAKNVADCYGSILASDTFFEETEKLNENGNFDKRLLIDNLNKNLNDITLDDFSKKIRIQNVDRIKERCFERYCSELQCLIDLIDRDLEDESED